MPLNRRRRIHCQQKVIFLVLGEEVESYCTGRVIFLGMQMRPGMFI